MFKNFFVGGLGCGARLPAGHPGPARRDRLLHRRPAQDHAERRGDHASRRGNDRTLRLFGFVDMGNVYGEDEPMSFTTCAPRSVGLSWLSPIGPLRIASAYPFKKEAWG